MLHHHAAASSQQQIQHQHQQHQHQQHQQHSIQQSSSLPISSTSTSISSPISPASIAGNDKLQYFYHHLTAAHHPQPPLSQHYQEDDIQLTDYQIGTSINHHHPDLIGIDITTSPSNEIPQLGRLEKRKRTNYSLGGNKVKIEEAVKYLLELSERARPNVRNVAEKMGIPYNTLRDHFKKAQGLMAPPRRTVFDYPMAEYKGPDILEEQETVVHHTESDLATFATFDPRRRGRKPALPRLIEYQLKAFIKGMGALGLVVDRTQLKQVAYKIASDLNLTEFKATDMWLQAFQARHGLSVAHSGGSKKKGWRLPDVPVYGSSSYSHWKTAQSKSHPDVDFPPISPGPASSDQPVSDGRNYDDLKSDDADKTNLSLSLPSHQSEIDYSYHTQDYSSSDEHRINTQGLPSTPFSPHRFPPQFNDEELRLRSISSFRTVLEEIQVLIGSEGGCSNFLSFGFLSHDSLPRPITSSNTSSIGTELHLENSRETPDPWDLIKHILPAIEACTVHGTGVPDDILPADNYYGTSPPYQQSSSLGHRDETSAQYQHAESLNEPNKRQRVLSLAAFQSQLDEPHQNVNSIMINSTYGHGPPHAGRMIMPEDEHTITASALVATQVLYNTPSAPHMQHHPLPSPINYSSPFSLSTSSSSSSYSSATSSTSSTSTSTSIAPPVFGSMNTTVDLRRGRVPDGMITSGGNNNTNMNTNEPAILTTKIHHPRSVFYTTQPTDQFQTFRSENNSSGQAAAAPAPATTTTTTLPVTMTKPTPRLNPDVYDMAMI